MLLTKYVFKHFDLCSFVTEIIFFCIMPAERIVNQLKTENYTFEKYLSKLQ